MAEGCPPSLRKKRRRATRPHGNRKQREKRTSAGAVRRSASPAAGRPLDSHPSERSEISHSRQERADGRASAAWYYSTLVQGGDTCAPPDIGHASSCSASPRFERRSVAARR